MYQRPGLAGVAIGGGGSELYRHTGGYHVPQRGSVGIKGVGVLYSLEVVGQIEGYLRCLRLIYDVDPHRLEGLQAAGAGDDEVVVEDGASSALEVAGENDREALRVDLAAGDVVLRPIGHRGELLPSVAQRAVVGAARGGAADAPQRETGPLFDIPLDIAIAALAGAGKDGIDGVALVIFDKAVAIGVGGIGVRMEGGYGDRCGRSAFEADSDSVGAGCASRIGDGQPKSDGVAESVGFVL